MNAEVRPIRPDVEMTPGPRVRVFRAIVTISEDGEECGRIELDLVDRWDHDSGRAAAWIADEFHRLTAMDADVVGGYLYEDATA